ncbi:MAG: hypothetical protein Q9N67_10480 [Ghiorsea sp.]|nr:hypothetical protein [Ghiorsea sp.]
MSQIIEIPQDLYIRLGNHAKVFETPAQVIERLLGHYENKNIVGNKPLKSLNKKGKKDITKYTFNHNTYGKGRLVHAIIKSYINDNNPSLEKLSELFPKHLQGSIGVFNKITFIQQKYAHKDLKRHYVKPDELLVLNDGTTIAICDQWGIGNIDLFINQAISLGYQINRNT